jgi:hypothetical protein
VSGGIQGAVFAATFDLVGDVDDGSASKFMNHLLSHNVTHRAVTCPHAPCRVMLAPQLLPLSCTLSAQPCRRRGVRRQQWQSGGLTCAYLCTPTHQFSPFSPLPPPPAVYRLFLVLQTTWCVTSTLKVMRDPSLVLTCASQFIKPLPSSHPLLPYTLSSLFCRRPGV